MLLLTIVTLSLTLLTGGLIAFAWRQTSAQTAALSRSLPKPTRRSRKEPTEDYSAYEIFSSVRLRLLEQIILSARSGLLNLMFGMVFSLAGLFVALWMLIDLQPADHPWYEASVPRITVIVFIEILAYFFLRVYKRHLDDQRYYQNEITTIEMKFVSLFTPLESYYFAKVYRDTWQPDSEHISAVLESLVRTERNHVLSADQTTEDLERSRHDFLGMPAFLHGDPGKKTKRKGKRVPTITTLT